MCFTRNTNRVKLMVGSGSDQEKAEESCLISNSLSAESLLEFEIVVDSR